ncbi:putative calmodulin-dependent protein kinase type 1 [Neocallimastix lanati (nom. inval.)]|jgi:serine/threonine protein kinase|uniref:Putative calmodulin-dependent protein kinase type 1 n=1 Tax=Neocallimastix californiae TaxID=1754190 RepID=A0A1Y2E6F6_9FUNG|nr:putative calmodulin-dependent protein kinase type 1 [Neocallimastix sp. JGI-2020a]ORY66866.1 putative calmodulin-dependent protein kinase type 1 [Neocallimastix californiae]|eukprot:ORY66866.1 putative calmodulin-dependent protein kinase type 1 [Neocallimastix californiae]
MSALQKTLAPCEYKTGKILGQGSYAIVKEAIHVKTGKTYAVKVINKKLMRGKEFMILNEIEILKRVSKGHPNIVTLYDYFETPNNLYLVMDLCTGGELFDRIYNRGHYYEADAADIVRTVCSAVAYLHEKNIVHRDIKAENMLFKGKEENAPLLIADFGLSKIIDNQITVLMTTCGTPGYMAPEVIARTGHGKPVDMWSIGVLTYFLLCGYTPFDGQRMDEEVHNILAGNYKFEPVQYWFAVSETARDFIRKLLVVNPNLRMTAKQALQHPWLQPTQFNVRSVDPSKNLMPNFKSNFDAKRKWKKAMDSVLFTQRVKIHNATSEAIKVAIEEDINPEIVVGSINLNDNTDNIEKLKKFTSSDFNTIDTIEDNKENKVKETARN